MGGVPASIAEFLAQPRLAVAGVSRQANQPANAIFRRLRALGATVYPLNPATDALEGETCYPRLAALPERVEGLVIAAPPMAAAGLVEECAALGIGRVWFHRGLGPGSVDAAAVAACRTAGLLCIVGGCPLMYAGRVDAFHRCLRWWLERRGRIEA